MSGYASTDRTRICCACHLPALGRVPRKRHIQFRENGTLLTEEVMGLEGFSGNESILYHLHSPCRVKEIGAFEPIEREEWDARRRTRTGTSARWASSPAATRSPAASSSCGTTTSRSSSAGRPTAMDFFYRNGEGDEVVFVHEGKGTLETIFGDLPYREGDYIVIPRGTTYRFVPEGEQRYLVFSRRA